ncbi:hypothetical protein DFH08DRAFT_957523 [Mycena albidolilacea]|uniref:Secreted protein n=1 Tax=Mycena albidolilacea TaxID=1033008 RepID=A0AAD7A7E0_9AGAR|nr:hypothetical protein DFH08DRAFT_957523 [Mycena albidolilacea]
MGAKPRALWAAALFPTHARCLTSPPVPAPTRPVSARPPPRTPACEGSRLVSRDPSQLHTSRPALPTTLPKADNTPQARLSPARCSENILPPIIS